MNQLQKTMLFMGAAAASAALAYATRPTPAGSDAPANLSEPLFADFTDPLTARSLRIVRFDEGLSTLSEIEVRENGGIWTLPSHENYPADAQDRIKQATTQFVDLRPISVVSDNQGDHDLYGVLEPAADKSAVGDQGVGTLVNVKGDGGKNLVDLIIGSEVKGATGQRYVRHTGQAQVYTAKVDPANLPVKFDDWIEKDLLKLNAWDLSQLVLKDYTFQVATTLRGPVTDFDQRLEITASDENGKWKLDNLLVAREDQLQPTQLEEGQQLNQEKLNALKTALDQLEIVDVERKPSTLGEDLRAGEDFFNDQAGVDSLLQRGFYPVRVGDKDTDVELLSSDGEVLARTKEGVEYVLRFGRVKGVDTESGGDTKLHRYLLVSTRVHMAQFPEPELLPLPEKIEDLTPPAVPAEPTAPEATTAPPTEPANPPAKDPATSERQLDTQTRLVVTQEGENAPADETPAAPSTPTTPAPDAPAPSSTPAPTDANDPAKRLQAEREQITKENQRKIDERKDKLTKAQKKVNELNFRFADWYYVISDDVYKKIHLGQSDIIEAKANTATEGTESTEVDGAGATIAN